MICAKCFPSQEVINQCYDNEILNSSAYKPRGFLHISGMVWGACIDTSFGVQDVQPTFAKVAVPKEL